MAEKKLIRKVLLRLPWWADFVLAGVVYYGLKFWLPGLYFQHTQVNRFVHSLPQFAELFALILVVNGIFSAWHAWQNRK